MGANEGDAVGIRGALVGSFVGCEVGPLVGCAVGPLVGCAVGALVGCAVGACVGDLVGLALGGSTQVCPEEVQSGLHWYCPTQSHVH